MTDEIRADDELIPDVEPEETEEELAEDEGVDDGSPDDSRAIARGLAGAFPNIKLHLYGKLAARPGRKMGHLTALNSDVEAAYRAVVDARNSLLS